MSTSGTVTFDQTTDLCFLMERCLRHKNFHRTATVLQEEMVSSSMIPERYDWRGGKHKRTYDEWVEKHLNVDGSHLQRLCENLIPLLQQIAPQPLFEHPSLLRTGRYSLLRTAESVGETKWSSKRFSALVNGHSICPPHNLTSANRVYHLRSRELGQKTNPYLASPVSCLYGRMKMSLQCLGHLSSVYCVLFDRTGSKILTGSDDCLIKCWCARTGRLLFSFRGHQAEICDIDVSYDNALLASGSCNKVIRVWDLQSAAPVAVLQGHSGTITAVEFSPVVDGDIGYLLSTGRDGNVCFWRWSVKAKVFSDQPIKFQERSRPGVSMLCTSWSSGGRFAVVGGSDAIIYVYHLLPEAVSVVKVVELTQHSDKVDSIWFAHEGCRFASGSCDGTACIWKFEKSEWSSIALNVSETLETPRPLSSTHNSSDKLKVVMVAWDCVDNYAFTSLTDFSIKVWRASDGKLMCILKGHTDEAYCLEGHPTDPRILLSAGHDGNIILWDLQTREQVMKYYNHLEGQGHGAVFDAKFSPSGDHIACTDSHGHIIIFSYGDGGAYTKVPEEQFFHTDYRPLIHDSFGAVLDEQTQQAPHRMPPPFLVDVDGNPHPPDLQRLVPGREDSTTSALLPIVEMVDNVAPDQEGSSQQQQQPTDDAAPQTVSQSRPVLRQRTPSRIDEAIIRLRGESGNGEPSTSASPARNAPLALRREGEVAGVRQMHSNAPRSQLASQAELNALCSRQLVPLPSAACARNDERRRAAMGDLELAWYDRERQRRKKVAKKLSVSEMAESLQRRSKKILRLALRKQNCQYDEDPIDDDIQADAPSTRIRLSTFIAPRHHYGTRLNARRETDSESEKDSEQKGSSREASSDESSCEDDDSDVWQSPSSHDRNGNQARTRRKASGKRNNRILSSISWETGVEEQEQSASDESEQEDQSPVTRSRVLRKTKASTMSVRSHLVDQNDSPFAVIPGSLPPDVFMPPKWIQQEHARPFPYLPQIGDCVIYFRQGHELYLEAVSQKNVWDVGADSDICFKTASLRNMETCEVIEVKYEIGPPTLCFVKLERLLSDLDAVADDAHRTITLRFHDMPDVIDFLVLKDKYEASIKCGWKPGDRFRSVIDDAWWYGTVLSSEPLQADASDSKFQSLLVVWDSDESERMSPWDMEPVPEFEESCVVTRSYQAHIKCGVPISDDEMREIFRSKQTPREWWGVQGPVTRENGLTKYEVVDREISRICRGIETLVGCGMFFPFSGPVDLKLFPAYVTAVAFPTDLSLILRRLQNRFYRRMAALLDEVKLLESNAVAFNEPESAIVKAATLLVELLTKFVRKRTCDNIEDMIEELRIEERYTKDVPDRNGGSTSEEADERKPELKKLKKLKLKKVKKKTVTIRSEERPPLPNIDEWKQKCSELLSLVWDTEDAIPFRESVNEDEYPDYCEFVEKPMALRTIRENLAFAQYDNPSQVNDDLALIFKNSKAYNTNKKSRIYSMTIRLQALVSSRMDLIIQDWEQAILVHERHLSKYSPRKSRNLRRSLRNLKKAPADTEPRTSRYRPRRGTSVLPKQEAFDDQQQCSSTSLVAIRNSPDSESSYSSGDESGDGPKSDPVAFSHRMTRSRKRQRNRPLRYESSDDDVASSPSKKIRMDFLPKTPPPQLSLPGSRRQSSSASSSSKRAYEYDPDFLESINNAEASKPRNATTRAALSTYRRLSPTKASKQPTRRLHRERKNTAFISSCDGSSDEGGKASIAGSLSGADNGGGGPGNDFLCEVPAPNNASQLRRTRRRPVRRIVDDDVLESPKKKERNRSSTTAAATIANTRATRYRGQRTVHYAEESGDSDSNYGQPSVSSRGRIRRMSTRALESRVC